MLNIKPNLPNGTFGKFQGARAWEPLRLSVKAVFFRIQTHAFSPRKTRFSPEIRAKCPNSLWISESIKDHRSIRSC